MRILVATDGSDCATVAVDLVAGIPWPTPVTIDVVQAVASGVAVFGGPWPPIPPVETGELDQAIREQAQQTLDAATDRLAGEGRTVEMHIAGGRAADVISTLAEEHGAELIVVGSRGHGTLETMLLGSTSAEVVDRAHVPVLVARGRSIGRVVLGWDGSDRAERAAACLSDWGVFGDSEIHVVSVADLRPPSWADSTMIDPEILSEAFDRNAEASREQHDQMAREMAERLAHQGLRSVAERRDGDPASQLVAAAEALEADLVVIGTHGRTGLSRWLMGSVARNVLHHVHCSVLVVRPAPEDEHAD
jgi:nucleotide-binding universal stress UspA family protein